MTNFRTSSAAIFATTFVVLLCLPCRAEAPAREDQVKAAFVYNFTQFVEWPANAFAGDESPFVVGVVGPSPLNEALAKVMENKAVGSHPIVVAHFVSVDAIGPCHVLFVPEAQEAQMPAVLAKIGKSPVLTVGEGDGFLPAGGAIRLLLEDSKMRFQLSPAVVDAASLRAGAKLMKLARIYRK